MSDPENIAAAAGASSAAQQDRGFLFVLSSPSGAGKTTLARALIAADPSLSLSISVTTRPPRPGEADGTDYYFIDHSRFRQMVEAGELLESAQVFDHGYGTPRASIMAGIAQGHVFVFDIDWQGARQLREKVAADVVSVFILPPSAAALHDRLVSRAQDAPDVVARRMARAAGEIEHWSEYDYVIVNADLAASLASLQGILAAERLKRVRRPGLDGFACQLLRDLARQHG